MKSTFRAKYFTLDWDNISIDEAQRRIMFILDNYANIQELVLSLSPLKGFHVRCWCFSDTNIPEIRKQLADDGRRLVNDLVNSPDTIHDILWSRKTLSGITWEAKPLIRIVIKTCCGLKNQTSLSDCYIYDYHGDSMCLRNLRSWDLISAISIISESYDTQQKTLLMFTKSVSKQESQKTESLTL